MLVSRGIVGAFDTLKVAVGRLDYIDIPWADAGKRRLRRRTRGGLDFVISMDHGQYLFHGAVLFNDEHYTVVVSRPEEPALIIDLSEASSIQDIVRQASFIGHAFGNQHIPIEAHGCSILVPVLTSKEIMEKTIRDLKLGELSLQFHTVRLGASCPLLTTGHIHA